MRWLLLFAMLFFILTSPAYGEPHVHADGVVVPDRVGDFYNRWHRPDMRDPAGRRTHSCCSRRDCFVPIVRTVRGVLQAWHPPTNQWVSIPDDMIERNTPDGEESPDGQNHVCINPETGNLYCYVDAAGI